eukprot:6202606-Pleurochrysis_carterae.AAC.1
MRKQEKVHNRALCFLQTKHPAPCSTFGAHRVCGALGASARARARAQRVPQRRHDRPDDPAAKASDVHTTTSFQARSPPEPNGIFTSHVCYSALPILLARVHVLSLCQLQPLASTVKS